MLNKGVTVSTCCLQTGHLGWLESLTDRKRHGLLSVHDITKDNSRLCTLPAHKMTQFVLMGSTKSPGFTVKQMLQSEPSVVVSVSDMLPRKVPLSL